MNDQQRAAMTMALGAMLTAQNTLIFKCGGELRPMERETLDDLVEAITFVQLALAAKTRGNKMGSSVDPTPTYFVGHPDGTYSVAEPQPSVNQPTAHKSLSLDDVLFVGASNEIAEALAQPQEPEKKWVGLTDEEYDLCCQGTQPLNIRVRMVAMALKNKNTGA